MSNNVGHVLVIDDEPQIRKLVRVVLEGAGYRVHDAAGGREGLLAAANSPPVAIILDLGLGDMDGVEVVRRLREWSAVPVLILSVMDATEQKVRALDAGADDYLAKPFAGEEMIARLRALLRRAGAQGGAPVVLLGDLAIDLVARQVRVAGREVRLTPIEYALLSLLARHSGRVVTHNQLLLDVWGPGHEEQRQYLRVHLAGLRAKLGPAVVIRADAGVGYRLELSSGEI